VNENQLDEGILTNKNHLPIKTLHYGDGDSKSSWIIYNIGDFKCSGKSENSAYPRELKTADYFFKFFTE
jgi:hypothetical protein